MDLKESYHLPEKKVRVPIKQYPIQLNLYPEGQALHLYPEIPMKSGGSDKEPYSYILFDPEQYFSGISGFMRLNDGAKLVLEPKRGTDISQLIIDPVPRERLLSILNRNGSLVFKNHSGKSGSCIAPLTKDKQLSRIAKWRYEKLERLRKIYGGPIKQLSDKESLSLIKSVNKLLGKEAYRPADKKGRPGLVINLPKKIIPILVGDLHAKLNNLLVVLTQNGFLESLEDGSAALVILGDAVHREDKGHYDEMESSLLIMDFIFKLKLRFPEQVFYIRGNHDSFSEEIGKAGIPQGLLWSKTLIKIRGKEYRKEMEHFYDQLPLIAYSKHFIASHAAPPLSTTSLSGLINGRGESRLHRELVCNRLRMPHRPGGYGKSDIKKFRKILNLSADTPVVVGHTPLSLEETIWEKVGDIEQSLYRIRGEMMSGSGVMTRIGDRMLPLRYPIEPLMSLINSLSD